MALKKIGPTASQAVIPPESINKTTSKHQQNADLSSPLGDEDTNRLQQNNPRLQQYSDLPPALQQLRGKSAPEITLGIQDLTLREFLALPPSCNHLPDSDQAPKSDQHIGRTKDPETSPDLARMQGNITTPQGPPPKNNIRKLRTKLSRLQLMNPN
jgi:hypothetical protein